MPELPADVAAHREWLLSFLPVRPNALIVDLGCGAGDDLIKLAAQHPHPSARFVGIDASEKSIAAAKGAATDSRLTFRQAQLGQELPFEGGSVDAVYSNNLVECLANPETFARDVGRILLPAVQRPAARAAERWRHTCFEAVV